MLLTVVLFQLDWSIEVHDQIVTQRHWKQKLFAGSISDTATKEYPVLGQPGLSLSFVTWRR